MKKLNILIIYNKREDKVLMYKIKKENGEKFITVIKERE